MVFAHTVESLFQVFSGTVNEDVSNASVLFSIIVFPVSATYSAFIIKNERDILLLVPLTLLFVFSIDALTNAPHVFATAGLGIPSRSPS